jgi:hypothetical protein
LLLLLLLASSSLFTACNPTAADDDTDNTVSFRLPRDLFVGKAGGGPNPSTSSSESMLLPVMLTSFDGVTSADASK